MDHLTLLRFYKLWNRVNLAWMGKLRQKKGTV